MALGFAVAPLIARASVRAPGGGPPDPPSRARLWLCLAAAPALAAWAALVAPPAQAVLGALLAWQLLLLALLDADRFWLPKPLTLALIGTGLAAALPRGAEGLLDSLIGTAVGYASLALVAFAYRRLRGREGLGGGDAWLLAGGGAWTGWISLPTVLIWAAGGGLAYVGLRALLGRRLDAQDPVPFGVGLAVGIWLAWLYGPIGRA